MKAFAVSSFVMFFIVLAMQYSPNIRLNAECAVSKLQRLSPKRS